MKSHLRILSPEELEKVRHPHENSRLVLALLICLPLAVGLVVGAYLTRGMLLLELAILIASAWLFVSIAKARLVSNALRVSEKNFPEIQKIVNEAKLSLNYKGRVDVYIMEDGNVNTFLSRFLGSKFIILNSGFVSDMIDGQKLMQLKWIVTRFIGAMKTKQIRLDFLTPFLESAEQLILFNVLILPYTRSTQYTGDNIGLVVCQDLSQVMQSFDKFFVGNDLAARVNLEGILEQGNMVRSNFFAVLSRLFSPFPHNVNRYLNLLAFAKWYMPEQYHAYIRQNMRSETYCYLPNYYEDAPAAAKPSIPSKHGESNLQDQIRIIRKR